MILKEGLWLRFGEYTELEDNINTIKRAGQNVLP